MARESMRVRGPEVSRRGFLGGTAAMGVGTLAGSTMRSKAAKAAAPKGILTTAHWGVMRAVVENGKFVKKTNFDFAK